MKNKWSKYTGTYNGNNFFKIEIKIIQSKLFILEDFKKPCLLIPLDENKFRIEGGETKMANWQFLKQIMIIML